MLDNTLAKIFMAYPLDDSKICYIRQTGPDGFTPGLPHHHEALTHFLSKNPSIKDTLDISIPHTQGGHFVAQFCRINDVLCQYINEYGHKVDIMMTTPSHARFINRIIDHS